MHNVKNRLEAWRDAEHRRDALALGSPAWQDADDETQSAAKAFHAELAQTAAFYTEATFETSTRSWGLSARLDRVHVRAGD